VIRVPIIGPGMGSSEGPPRGRAVRTGVSIGLALLGLIVALVRSRRRRSARPGPDPDREGPAHPAVNAPTVGKAFPEDAPHSRGKAGADDAPIRPGWYGAVALVIAVLFAALSLFIYNQLDHWYRPVELSVQTNDPASGQQAMLGADTGPGVAWTLDGDVGQLTVVGPGSAEIMLPVPVTQCGAVIAQLDVPCGPQGISLPSPAEFSWSTAQTLSSQGNDETAAELDLEPSAGAHGSQSLVMSVTNAVPTLCFAVLTRATLTITVGRHHYVQGFPGFTTCSGLAAMVSSPGPAAPSLELTGLDGLTVTASTPTATLQGFTSQITLNPGGMSVQGAATVVALGSAGGSLSATLQVAPGSPALTMQTQPATSVMANGSQLVPSEWNRETVVFGPLLGGFVTVLVVTPLGLSLGVLTDALKRWPGPRRKDRGRGPEGGSS
jgi:hypothetical protein